MARLATNQSRAKAKPNTMSVRFTVSAHIAQQMGLIDGDMVEWDMDKKDRKWAASFTKGK